MCKSSLRVRRCALGHGHMDRRGPAKSIWHALRAVAVRISAAGGSRKSAPHETHTRKTKTLLSATHVRRRRKKLNPPRFGRAELNRTHAQRESRHAESARRPSWRARPASIRTTPHRTMVHVRMNTAPSACASSWVRLHWRVRLRFIWFWCTSSAPASTTTTTGSYGFCGVCVICGAPAERRAAAQVRVLFACFVRVRVCVCARAHHTIERSDRTHQHEDVEEIAYGYAIHSTSHIICVHM